MKAATAQLSTLDGTLTCRRTEAGIFVGIKRDDRIAPMEFPPLRANSAAALRTLIDDALEAQAAEDA